MSCNLSFKRSTFSFNNNCYFVWVFIKCDTWNFRFSIFFDDIIVGTRTFSFQTFKCDASICFVCCWRNWSSQVVCIVQIKLELTIFQSYWTISSNYFLSSNWEICCDWFVLKVDLRTFSSKCYLVFFFIKSISSRSCLFFDDECLTDIFLIKLIRDCHTFFICSQFCRDSSIFWLNCVNRTCNWNQCEGICLVDLNLEGCRSFDLSFYKRYTFSFKI